MKSVRNLRKLPTEGSNITVTKIEYYAIYDRRVYSYNTSLICHVIRIILFGRISRFKVSSEDERDSKNVHIWLYFAQVKSTSPNVGAEQQLSN